MCPYSIVISTRLRRTGSQQPTSARTIEAPHWREVSQSQHASDLFVRCVDWRHGPVRQGSVVACQPAGHDDAAAGGSMWSGLREHPPTTPAGVRPATPPPSRYSPCPALRYPTRCRGRRGPARTRRSVPRGDRAVPACTRKLPGTKVTACESGGLREDHDQSRTRTHSALRCQEGTCKYPQVPASDPAPASRTTRARPLATKPAMRLACVSEDAVQRIA
jgi:hypothetical protein